MAVAAALRILLALGELHAALGTVVAIGFFFVVAELLLARHRSTSHCARNASTRGVGANATRSLLLEFARLHPRPRSTVDSAAVYGTANEGSIPSEVAVVKLRACNFLVHVQSCVRGSSCTALRTSRSRARPPSRRPGAATLSICHRLCRGDGRSGEPLAPFRRSQHKHS